MIIIRSAHKCFKSWKYKHQIQKGSKPKSSNRHKHSTNTVQKQPATTSTAINTANAKKCLVMNEFLESIKNNIIYNHLGLNQNMNEYKIKSKIDSSGQAWIKTLNYFSCHVIFAIELNKSIYTLRAPLKPIVCSYVLEMNVRPTD